MKPTKEKDRNKEFALSVGRALSRSARVARKTAMMSGAPLFFWKDGKVVAEKP
jgi:predicted GNAT family acetyltransferase